MGQIIVNYVYIFIMPFVIGALIRFGARKKRKAYILTVGMVLFAVLMWAIALIVPNHGSEAYGLRAWMATCLAIGALIVGLVHRWKLMGALHKRGTSRRINEAVADDEKHVEM